MQIRPYSPFREPEFVRQINHMPIDEATEFKSTRADRLAAVNLIYAEDRRRQKRRTRIEVARAFLSGVALFVLGWACAIGWGAL